MAQNQSADLLTQAFKQNSRRGGVGFAEQQNEFFTAKTREYVTFTQGNAAYIGELLQGQVAGQMPVGGAGKRRILTYTFGSNIIIEFDML